MTELSIILGSGLVVAFIGAVYAYGKLTQKIEHIGTTTDKLALKFDNHLKHETNVVQTDLSNLKTEVALLNAQIENLAKVVELIRKDRS
ncbi:hypothetical protein M1N82_01630 [Dehalococcoidia bacterium]|nr:hypothetical protein [Dehalococcoidia bacterium]MCL0084233.1 hypothetical protein [Dehalococcoidia bacterium]